MAVTVSEAPMGVGYDSDFETLILAGGRPMLP